MIPQEDPFAAVARSSQAFQLNDPLGFGISLQTGQMNTDKPPAAAYEAQVNPSVFTSSPGLVGMSGGSSGPGAFAPADGSGGGDVIGPRRIGIGGAIRAPVVSQTPVPVPAAAPTSSAANLINHDSLNAYRQARGLPLVQPPASMRGIGGVSMGAR